MNWTILFLLLFSGPPKFRIRDSAALVAGDEMDFALYVQIAVWILAGLWLAGDVWWGKCRLRRNLHWSIKLFFLALCASLLTTISISLTAFKLYQIAVTLCFVVRHIQEKGANQTLRLIAIGSLLLCALIVTAIPFMPDMVSLSETGAPRLRGWGIADASAVSSIALVLVLAGYPKLPRVVRELVCLALGVMLFFSLTRTAWLAFTTVAVMAFLRKPKLWSLFWIRAAVVVGVVVLLTVGVGFTEAYRDNTQLANLSDRAFLWTFLFWETIDSSPYTGLGYFAGSRSLTPEFRPEFGTAHSIFMEAFVGAGCFGLAAFLLMTAVMTMFGLRIWWRRNDPPAFAVCGLWFLVLITGLFGSELDSTPFAFTFWTICIMLPRVKVQRHSSGPS